MLKPAPDTENLVARLVDEEVGIEMGIYPVLYGMRVRAGFIGQPAVRVDWCCGANQLTLEWAYTAVRQVLEEKAGPDVFNNIPLTSKIKPIYNDADFVLKVSQLFEWPVHVEPLSPISDLRRRYFNQWEWSV